ncbi:insecticidal toxin complex protein C [Serratia sp. FS14]|uniref:hypothetical protein n=1 Tax=Serratia sp. (strain FS14) TaxID=1327989 RepID=UPI0004998044|nr:hypothetical protein [Serratia sp. FS14]AIA46975.1 insecticidal toxin complex protein C [Serratia sp. FS14]
MQIWDNAGVTVTQALSLSGVPLEVSRRLLADPEGTADWRGDEAQCQARLEPAARALVTRAQADATGTVVSATSAHGVTTHSRYDISGALAGIRLSWQEQGQSREQVVLAQVAYGADGQVVSRTAGNGVVSRYTYDLQSRQLTRVTTERPPGHLQGAQMLQDLHYGYDPVGNVLHRAGCGGGSGVAQQSAGGRGENVHL